MRRLVTFSSAAILLGLVACGDSGGGIVGDATTTNGDATTTSTNDSTTSTSTNTNTSTTDASTTTTTPDTSVTQDTAVTPDTVVEDQGEGLCMGILGCVGDQCGTATTQEEFNACVQTCASVADSQAEVTNFSAYATCEGDCLPEGATGQLTGEQEKAVYQCLLDTCVDSSTACQAGADFGTANCLTLNACLTACGSGGSARCQRDCFAASTEDADKTFVSLQYCLLAQCADKSGAAFNTCASAAQQNPPCATYVTQCRGNSGAAPAAGGAGGAGGDFDAFDPAAFRARYFRQH